MFQQLSKNHFQSKEDRWIVGQTCLSPLNPKTAIHYNIREAEWQKKLDSSTL
jgi:hypothetical protein